MYFEVVDLNQLIRNFVVTGPHKAKYMLRTCKTVSPYSMPQSFQVMLHKIHQGQMADFDFI